jgi:hypothetical protein
MADVFLSYSRHDVQRAQALVDRFTREEWSVFWDGDIPVGRRWEQVLHDELSPAGCVVVLWSQRSIASEWVRKEAAVGQGNNVLLPVRLERVTPPDAFCGIQAEDLTAWDGRADSRGLERLVDAVAEILQRRKGVSLVPLQLLVVVARPKRHPDLGATVNLTCQFVNQLEAPADLRGLTASAALAGGGVSYELDWRLAYDVTPGETDHVFVPEPEPKLSIPASSRFKKGLQLRAPLLTTAVNWPQGRYRVAVRGWINRPRLDAAANLKCQFDATLPAHCVREIVRHQHLADEEWVRRAYSDDAFGVPFTLSNVRQGLAAT